MAASGCNGRSATQDTSALRAAQRECDVLGCSSDVPAQPALRTCLSLAQGWRACARRSLAAEKFYSIKFPHSLCEMLVILTRCNGAQLTQDLRAKSIRK